jgi:cobalt/nickel transport system permease protein
MRMLMPSTRLVCGTFVFASCSVVPLNSPCGVVLFFGVLIGWPAGCGIPLRRLSHVLRFAACLFLPLVLLAPFALFLGDSGSWSEALRVPLVIGLRGTACVAMCAATLSVLDLAELGEGLSGLPLPRTLAALIMQIAHQAALMTEESRRMVTALRVRGVPSATVSVRLRCLFALPVLWLLRLLLRAERVSAAMEVRGFDGPLRGKRGAGESVSDAFALAFAFCVFAAVLFLRWEVN